MLELEIPQGLGQEDRLVTSEFQEVFDRARDKGGARVVVPEGTYHIGSVRLYGHTELHLEEGAHLVGSTDIADYTDWEIPSLPASRAYLPTTPVLSSRLQMPKRLQSRARKAPR